MSSDRYQRFSDCRDSLEHMLRGLVEHAMAEGWSYDEISSALINFAVDVVPEPDGLGSQFEWPSVLVH